MMGKYFSVVYDIQRPPPLELVSHQDRFRVLKWNRAINNFVNELKSMGTRINYSVYVLPAKHYDRAKRLVEHYTKLFNELNVKNDIYILEYAPSSDETLKNKVRLQLKLQFNDLKRKYDEAVKISERRTIKKQIELLRQLAISFGELDLAEQFVLGTTLKVIE